MHYAMRNKIGLVTAVVMMLSACEVFAWGGRGGGHYYHGGHYYERGWFGFGTVAAALTLGAVVATLPREPEVVVVNRSPYYCCDNVYYQRCPSGYVVVQPPVAVQPVYVQAPMVAQPVYIQPPPVAPVVQTVTVPAPVSSQPAPVPAAPSTGQYSLNIPNSDGTTYTTVVINQKGNGYVGPQGEYYPEFPKVEQLKAMYGK